MRIAFIIGLLSVVIAGGILGTLWSLDAVKFPALGSTPPPPVVVEHRPVQPTEPVGPPPGSVRLILAGRDVPAYSQLSPDALRAPNGQFQFIDIPEESLQPGTLRTVADLAGRVLRADKRRGFLFTEADFFPKGTRPGLTAGIPPGKRAVALPAEKIQGIALLRAFDTFDIVASIPIKETSAGGKADSRAKTKAKSEADETTGIGESTVEEDVEEIPNPIRQANSVVLARHAVVVLPAERLKAMTPDEAPAARRAAGRTPPAPAPAPVAPLNPDEQDMVIALEPEEITALTQAMATGAVLTAALRTGRLESDEMAAKAIPDRIVESPEPERSTIHVVEKLVGRHRDVTKFPDEIVIHPEPAASAAPN